jgi:hypothetical protein
VDKLTFIGQARCSAHNRGYEQLHRDVVDHDKQLEMLERRYEDMDDELNWMSDGTYHQVAELEGRVEQLEGMVVELRSGLHRSLVELMRPRLVVNANNIWLVSFLHGQDNPVMVEGCLSCLRVILINWF